ncbi:hypothetical protein Misp01_00180 [Microtetraspora sp. NBRC 13810]|nr:hypothetical protein Misp01_00180 [Microtetraspora sp. NBRC 13810]
MREPLFGHLEVSVQFTGDHRLQLVQELGLAELDAGLVHSMLPFVIYGTVTYVTVGFRKECNPDISPCLVIARDAPTAR